MTAIMSRSERGEGRGLRKDRDRIGVFMTAIMSRKERRERRGLKENQDKIGVFMTAIMSRRRRGKREKERTKQGTQEKTGRPGMPTFS